MKRVVLSLSAAALVLCMAAIAFAEDAPATAPSTTAPAKEGKAMHHGHHHAGAAAAAATIDLNSATKEQLMTLPGVDDATADKIVAGRPFTMRSDLTKKSILTKEQYGKLRSKITVKKAS